MRRWPEWITTAAAIWAASFGLALTLLPPTMITWPAVVVLALGASVAALTISPWSARLPSRPVTIIDGTVAALALAASCWVLLDLISLVLTGRVEDPDGNSNWLVFAQRLGAVLTGVLFTGAALAWHRRSAGTCARCGRVHPPEWTVRRRPAPHAAPPVIRRIAYAGCLAFLPYLTAHSLGALGVPGIEPDGYRPPLVFVLALLAGIGLAAFLLLGLVRPWGMVFPRWTLWFSGRRVPRPLPLVPVWLIAPTLSVYGIILVVIATLQTAGVMADEGGPALLIAAAGPSFGGYGIALAVAAVSYQRRTTPVCGPAR